MKGKAFGDKKVKLGEGKLSRGTRWDWMEGTGRHIRRKGVFWCDLETLDAEAGELVADVLDPGAQRVVRRVALPLPNGERLRGHPPNTPLAHLVTHVGWFANASGGSKIGRIDQMK